jgi:hypothetical protein
MEPKVGAAADLNAICLRHVMWTRQNLPLAARRHMKIQQRCGI